MTPTITAIRAIGADFARRLYYPVAITSAVILALLITAVFLLGTLSQWWLLLLIPVVILLCVAFGVFAIVWLVIRTVRPIQTKAQRLAVKAFVDKLQRVSDTVQTPKFILLFRIVRDIAAPRQDGFIGSIADDTTSLKRDFRELQKLF
jgi:NADH:ubiquinone oxidoreductase subunit 6 (subunit J)